MDLNLDVLLVSAGLNLASGWSHLKMELAGDTQHLVRMHLRTFAPDHIKISLVVEEEEVEHPQRTSRRALLTCSSAQTVLTLQHPQHQPAQRCLTENLSKLRNLAPRAVQGAQGGMEEAAPTWCKQPNQQHGVERVFVQLPADA